MGAAARRAAAPTSCLVAVAAAAARGAAGSRAAKRLLEEAKRYKEQGADKPFLDVWFADANNGYVVGAYNLIFRTADGGRNWEPWFERTDNPKFFNLYAIRPAAGGLFIAGEGGLVLKLDPDAQRFHALQVPYKGSFFGVVGDRADVLVFGLRGNAFRSADGGQTWSKVEVGLPASIVAGTTTGEGTIVLADAGRADRGQPGWRANAFRPALLAPTMPLAGIADAGNGRIRAGWPARRDGRGTGRPLISSRRAAARRKLKWLVSPTIWNRCPSYAGSPTSTGSPATCSSGSSSTTAWRWSSSARSSPSCWATSRRRSSC